MAGLSGGGSPIGAQPVPLNNDRRIPTPQYRQQLNNYIQAQPQTISQPSANPFAMLMAQNNPLMLMGQQGGNQSLGNILSSMPSNNMGLMMSGGLLGGMGGLMGGNQPNPNIAQAQGLLAAPENQPLPNWKKN